MRHKTVFAVSGILLSLAITPAFASPEEKDTGYYFTLGVGKGSSFDVDYEGDDSADADISITGDTGFGYRFNKNIRAEVTYSYTDLNISNAWSSIEEGETHSIMLGGYYDFASDSKYTPYIGGGLGYANLQTDASKDEENCDAFTYQAKLGLSYEASDKVDVYGEAAYQIIGPTNIADKDVDPFSMIKAHAGLRYKF